MSSDQTVDSRPCPPEETLARFLERKLSPPESDALTSHLDGCASCRLAVGALAEPGSTGAPEPPREEAGGSPLLQPGEHLGPYRIDGWLGGGAMGDIYQAYDERLKRPLALKRVRRKVGSPEAEAQLWREAQTLARLRHPNVVAVHDVGVTDGRAWLAMELVDGVTLRDWTQTPHPAPQVLDVFRQAALGLAAAHQAGVVHRDFKPENVLVGRDGRVQVTDFGLAELTGTDDDALVVAGTPAYMSPEQSSGGKVDPRADQYSFCVALYEALEGTRPGASLRWTARVPARVKRAVARGLETLPSHRFESIEQLARALEPRASRPQAWVMAAAALLVVSGGGAIALHRAHLCSSGPAQVAQTWSDERRAKLSAIAGHVGTPFARETIERLTPLLDRWSTDWAHAFSDRCEATRLRGEQSEQLLDAQVRCLDVERRKMGQLLEVLESEPAAGDWSRVVPAFFSIDPPAECLIARGPSASAALPADVAAATRVDAVRVELDQAEVIASAGRYQDALAKVRALEPEVTRLAFKPLSAQYQLALARSYLSASQADPASEPLAQAFSAAVALADDELAFEATLLQAQLAGTLRDDFPTAHAKLVECHAWLERLASPPKRERELAMLEGFIDTHSGEYEAARTSLRRAVQLARQQQPLNPDDLTDGLVHLAVLEYATLHAADAEPLAKEAVDVAERAFGPHHRQTANAHQVLGLVHYEQGRYDAALDDYQRALDARRVATPNDAQLADCHLNVSQALQKLDRYDEAIAQARESLRLHQAAHLDEAATADQMFLAMLETARGQFDAAFELAQASLSWREQHLGPTHRDTGASLYALADLQWAHGDYAAAEASFRRSLQIDQKLYGDEGQLTALDLAGIGRSIAHLGRLQEADALLERARATVTKAAPQSPRLPGIELHLASVKADERDFKAALALLDQVSAAQPKGWVERVRLAWLFHRAHAGLGHRDDAERFAAQCRALLAEHPELQPPERVEALGPGDGTAPKRSPR